MIIWIFTLFFGGGGGGGRGVHGGGGWWWCGMGVGGVDGGDGGWWGDVLGVRMKSPQPWNRHSRPGLTS